MINDDAFRRAEREGRLEAKVRYTPKTHRVNIQPYGDALKVVFEEKVRAAAPGQYVVFYCGSECLGGAEIIKQNNKGQ